MNWVFASREIQKSEHGGKVNVRTVLRTSEKARAGKYQSEKRTEQRDNRGTQPETPNPPRRGRAMRVLPGLVTKGNEKRAGVLASYSLPEGPICTHASLGHEAPRHG